MKKYFPEKLYPDANGLCCLGGDLEPEILLEAYSRGLFPWTSKPRIGWFSPDPRMILLPQRFTPSNRLLRKIRSQTFTFSFDQAFGEVINRCALPRKKDTCTWITSDFIQAYAKLHQLGIAHSAEVRHEGNLVGGLYGLAIGRAFFGESMFSLKPDGSKIALAYLCRFLAENGFHFIDCQVPTAHLASLGAHTISRKNFNIMLEKALRDDFQAVWKI